MEVWRSWGGAVGRRRAAEAAAAAEVEAVGTLSAEGSGAEAVAHRAVEAHVVGHALDDDDARVDDGAQQVLAL